MYTYQDLIAIGEDEQTRMDFVHAVVTAHRGTPLYFDARNASEYYKHRNVTIRRYQKLLYTMSGQAVPDNFSSNWKVASNFFRRFVTQEVQYLLGNGVEWENEATAGKLGEDFDARLQELAKAALWGGVAFGFFNLDHLTVFDLLEFAPLYDEENGALSAGVRFWQVATDKPLRATFYELDGYTDYLWENGKGEILHDKRPYVLKTRTTEADGTEIYDGENYPSFPIVPLFANDSKQSELVGLREQIDCYDLIKSGFANDVDDASQIYWTIQNAGGMDDVDLARFIERMKTVKAAVINDDGAKAESHTMEVPYASRETLLDRLQKDLYKDAMALDTENIASGATTATQIKAAYEPLNSKCDDFEYCVRDFLTNILFVAGLEDNPSFTRSVMINTQEEIQTVLSAATYLSDDYVTRKVLNVLGDGDLADEVLAQMDADTLERATEAFARPDDKEPAEEEETEQSEPEEA